ncbi:unnamed protein product [Rotaria sp. Silwood1]|nr:unnamed protein product [Rotaria sp. Silwood1]
MVAPTTFTKLPETISRHSKNTNNTIENRQTHSALYDDMNLNLSDDENEEAEDDEADDKKPNENQIKNQHTDSDDQVPIHSDTENDDEINRTNPHTLSLSDFITGKHSPVESSTDIRKRSLSPQIPAQEIKQNKRKEELIKSFSSCVNIPIDVKQPTLPITIPTYLFSNQSNKTDDEQIIEKSQKTPKRYANGTIKQDTNTQMIDNSNTTNGTQQKKNKTSHIYKQEPAISSTTIRIKEEPNITSHIVTSNEILSTGNTITIAPMTDQPKKKPTAKKNSTIS